jgi:ubiquinone/menaquinone biosynthesis C-methylase UbiE
MKGRVRSYESVAWCYDEIAELYSLGRIARAKAWEVEQMRAGEAVLYAGIGGGEDALLAARCGVDVTGVDLSRAMLDRTRRRLQDEGLKAELHCVDLFDHQRSGYDAVVANFVLNVFSRENMRAALTHLAGLVRPGGRLMVADFAPPSPHPVSRWLTVAYYRPINWAAWAMGLCALHPIYDYTTELSRLGFTPRRRRDFSVVPGMPPFYATWVADAPA